MTFQCKKGYFWSNYRSGPHLVEQRRRKYQNLDTRALERECCQVKIKVYMSLYSTICPIFCVISDDFIRYLISITQVPQFLLNDKIYYDKGSTIHPYLEHI